jgi:hypothetical protein
MNNSTKNREIAIKAAVTAIETYPSASALAREFGLNRVTVRLWKKTGVPIKHCPKVEKLTGVSCQLLHPEFFGSMGGNYG